MSNVLEYRKDSQSTARPRSLYTTTTHHNQLEENAYQNLLYYDLSPTDACWSNGVMPPPTIPVAPYTAASTVWRHPRAAKQFPGLYYTAEETATFTEIDTDQLNDPTILNGAASATPHGTICLSLARGMRVDITIDKAIRVINFKNNIVMAMSSTGAACALLHPNGRVHQYGSRVEILARDSRGNHKYAKMWYKGISFTSENCALVYLVDEAGTRTTTDNFSDLGQDFSLGVFYNESRHGTNFVSDALQLLQGSQYWVGEDEVENWIINNIRVSQARDGLVRVARNSNKYNMRTSPTNGTASLTTPFVHCTASMGQTSHLFVRRGERRMHYDGSSFIVRNAGHSAGFDERTQLKVF